MTDHEKPETIEKPEAAPPTTETPAAESKPETALPTAAPGARPDRRKPGGPPRGAGGGGGMPRRRTRESIPSLDDDLRDRGPRLKDLDDEIAGELEAALGDFSTVMGADTSRGARQQAQATGEPGRKKGKVISVRGKDVFVAVPGGRSEGVLPSEQFPEGLPAPGTEVEVSIEGYDPANGLLILSRQGAAVHADWSTVAEGMVVEARILETNKGGLTVDVNGIRGFMPISQIDLYRVEDAQQFVGQRLLCVITDADPSERNLIVSRRALLEKQREEQREKTWAELAIGQVRSGIVRNVREFGAFVDLGGIDGLVPISEMSWQRVRDPNTIVQSGQTVKVVVLDIDHEKRKVRLGLKQLTASPWDDVPTKYHAGQTVSGTVSRLAEFGAFVELEPGVEGLIHVSELARGRVWRVKDVVQEGQAVQVKVLTVDLEQRRIGLSLKATLPEDVVPAEEPAEEEAAVEPPKPRPRNPNLRGGVGNQTWTLPEPPTP